MTRHVPQPEDNAVLMIVAERMRPLLDDIVFVGGQVSSLLLTSHASTGVRATYDVDVIVSATTRAEYATFEQSMRDLDFEHDMRDGAPICRWVTPEGIAVDVMPAGQEVLGFSNKWYPRVVETAVEYPLAPDLRIRIPTAPAFLATKWVAFDARGAVDLLASHDLEDIITVVAGRPEVVGELASTQSDLRNWVARRTRDFLTEDLADYAIAGALNDATLVPDIINLVRTRFEEIGRQGSE